MQMFAHQKTKPMTINKERVYQSAKTIYHPEIFSKMPGTRLSRNR
jgi:hypothetical protein